MEGRHLIVAAPPLASNLATWKGRRDGEMWGGPLGGQFRGPRSRASICEATLSVVLLMLPVVGL